MTTNLYELLSELDIQDDKQDVGSQDTASTSSKEEQDDYNDSSEEEFDEEDKARLAHFDLSQLEEEQGHAPIFTRALLKRISADVSLIMSEQDKPLSSRRSTSLHYAHPNGQEVTIWTAPQRANSVQIHYSTRIEMVPGFQRRWGNAWSRSLALRDLNPDMAADQLAASIPPYTITSYQRKYDDSHLDPALMGEYRAKLANIQQLWTQSAACWQIGAAVSDGAARLKAPVSKIVCIGLGRIRLEPAWYGSTLQHLTAFTLAHALDKLNRQRDPKCPAVRVIVQDPCYEERDRILLPELTTSEVEFGKSDPETLLAIDANTIVISAFLPTAVPLPQIVADLFAGTPEKGPAMMLWDGKDMIDPARRFYRLNDRSSPAVARMFRGENRYMPYAKRFADLDDELTDALEQEGDGRGKHWLQEMRLMVRVK